MSGKSSGIIAFEGEDSMLQIGKYTLSLIEVPEGKEPPFEPRTHVWIEQDDGEGMSTRVENIEAIIAKFYKENF